ncbi:hypothetical protein BP00DRAFT_265770 [Aspergillus indologenus CBS 114.80]|uniref:Secreted protein n=1 Tax=Aspergillus indologenus CBS 114.80 TaxID=1450541 RepID=A0A2V5J9N5_9EURO|nr:hypothetical protein BP00DRAFT_265770 [Aspergillus indologenus CBS 114.80]
MSLFPSSSLFLCLFQAYCISSLAHGKLFFWDCVSVGLRLHCLYIYLHGRHDHTWSGFHIQLRARRHAEGLLRSSRLHLPL